MRPRARAVASLLAGLLLLAHAATGWRSWSWGLSYYNQRDGSAPLQGSRYSMCLQVQPYGALSLKSSVPFTLDGILGFYLKGGSAASGSSSTVASSGAGAPGNATRPYGLGDLELQFESSSPSSYTISRAVTLREVLESREALDGITAADALRELEAGGWAPIKVDMARLVLGSPGARYDRLTLGSCLQRLDACAGDLPSPVPFCLDKLVMVDKYEA